MKMTGLPVPTEEEEQRTLAEWLDLHRLCWLHIPNERGSRSLVNNVILKSLGVKAGAPDVLIFDEPPNFQGRRGVAIELKRRIGGRLRPEQRDWLDALSHRGWETFVCRGAGEAIGYLERLGYGRRRS